MNHFKTIQLAVAHRNGLLLSELTGPARTRSLARPRMIAMWLCREITKASFPEIGRAFHRDHTTVIYAVRRVEQWKRDDKDLARTLERLRTQLTDQIEGRQPAEGDAFVDACKDAGIRQEETS